MLCLGDGSEGAQWSGQTDLQFVEGREIREEKKDSVNPFSERRSRPWLESAAVSLLGAESCVRAHPERQCSTQQVNSQFRPVKSLT